MHEQMKSAEGVDFLQDELQDKIDKDLKDARTKILTGFDENVVARLRTRKGN